MTDDLVEVETLYTPNQPWGSDTFKIEGVLYRRKRKKEKPDTVIESDFGDVELRKLTRKEIRLMERGRKR